MDLINRLKHYMDTRQVTISQFADRCGIPRPTMSQLMNGRNKRISDEVINKIHNAFPDLSILWLMFGEGEMGTAPNIKISEPQIQENEAFVQPQASVQQDNTFKQPEKAGFSSQEPTSGTFENLLFETPENDKRANDYPYSGENAPKDNILFDSGITPEPSNTPHQAFQQSSYTAAPSMPAPNDITRTLRATSSPADPLQTSASPSSSATDSVKYEENRISIAPDAHKKITNIVVFYSDNSFQSFLPDA